MFHNFKNDFMCPTYICNPHILGREGGTAETEESNRERKHGGRVHDNVHDDMNMSLIMHDHSLFIGYDKHIIPHDQ